MKVIILATLIASACAANPTFPTVSKNGTLLEKPSVYIYIIF